MSKIGHEERHRPFIEELRESIMASYVDMLHRLNTDIVGELKRARGILKSGPILALLQGGKSDSDLFKARAPSAPKIKAPEAPKAPTAPSTEEDKKISRPGSRGGRWYRDAHGNVRYGDKPTARFKQPLTEDETEQLHRQLPAIIGGLTEQELFSLRTDLHINPLVFETFRATVEQAIAQGRPVDELFVENMVQGFFFGDDKPGTRKRSRQIFEDTLELFQEGLNDPKFLELTRKGLAKRREDAMQATKVARQQEPLIQGHFEELMSGDFESGNLKQLAILQDLGLFITPQSITAAMKYTDNEKTARKLIGNIRLNTERFNSLVSFGDTLTSEQQASLISAVMMSGAQAAREEDPTVDLDAYWKQMFSSPALDQLKTWFKDADKTYTDAEWSHITERLVESARDNYETLEAANANLGGFGLRALRSGQTNLRKIFENPQEIERVKKLQKEQKERIQNAVKAQTAYDHPLDPAMEGTLKKLGLDLFSFQRAGVAWMETIKSGILAYDAGLGKALPLNCQVLTPTGYRLMKNLKVGDSVIGKNGLPTEILGVFPQGMQDVYEVEFSDGAKVECDDNHIWTVKVGSGDRARWCNLTLKEIRENGYQNSDGRLKYAIPLVDPVHFEAKGERKIDPYVFGLLLGDGSLSADQLVFHKGEKDILEYLNGKFPGDIGDFDATRCRVRITGRTGKILRESLAFYGLLGQDSLSKFIPKEYLYAPVEERLALLQGLVDTDGSVLGSTIEFSSSSKELADHTAFLARSLGAIVRRTSRIPTYDYEGRLLKGARTYRLQMRFLNGLIPFRSEKHSNRYAANAHNPKERRIVDVVFAGRQRTQCIKVKAADGLFVIEHFTVTHNTPIAIAFISKLLSEKKTKRGIMVLPANLMDQWPQEIEKYRPGSKVQVISSDYSLEDRLRKLSAINSGELDADFVIVSAGTIGLTPETQTKLDAAIKAYKKEKGKSKVSPEEINEIIEAENLLGGDPLVQALKKLDGAMIFDEAHHGGQGLKDPNNIHHIAAREILAEREYKFGMTATPMPAGPKDLFHLSNLFHPGSAGESVSQFENRMVTYETVYDPESGRKITVPVAMDMKDLKAAKEAIKPFVFFQRKSSKQILDEMTKKGLKLPKIDAISQPLTLQGAAQEVYMSCERFGFDEQAEPFGGYPKGYVKDQEMFAKISNTHGDAAANNVMRMRAFVRKQRAAISPRLVDKNYKGPEPKIDATVDLITRHFNIPENHDKPVVIFGSWLDSLDIMKDALVKAGLPENVIGRIAGDVKQEDRDTVQAAINSGKMKVVLIGIKAGGAGLNLQKKSFRNVFLDKPWTPADMEQAIGRTWRTGSTADTVYVHHMKVANTTDERKYEKLGKRIEVTDALAFADMGAEYLSDTVTASMKRLVGSFDESVKEWTPEQEREARILAGLHSDDPTPLHSIESLRNDFNFETFGETLGKEKWKKVGDQKIEEAAIMDQLKLRDGVLTKQQYEKRAKKRAAQTAEWLSLTNAAMNHPVAKYAGENFQPVSPATSSLMGGRKDIKPKTRKAPAKKETEKAIKKVAPLPISGALKMHPEANFMLKNVDKNPFKDELDPKHVFWEAIRRTRPKSYKEAVKNVASWLVDYYKDSEEPMDNREASAVVTKFFEKKKLLDKFVQQGLIEVLS